MKWGIDQAAQDGICASVISSEGKEHFYGRRGFDTQVGSATAGEGYPIAGAGLTTGGMIFFRDVKA